METIDKRELLTFSLARQHLLRRAKRLDVVSNLCGLQAQFANNPQYALRIRASDFDPKLWGDGLIKVWTHRGTLHAIRQDELGLYLSARGVPDSWTDLSWGIPLREQSRWSDFLREKIAEGVDDREGLKAACCLAGMSPELSARVFYGWGGLISEMARRGLVAYRSGTEKRFLLPEKPELIDRDHAREILVERYFRACGPATLTDCANFTGLRPPELRQLLGHGNIPLRSVMCEGTEYFDCGGIPENPHLPRCLFLAGFDQMILGYKDRSRFMDAADRDKVVTCSGIIHPTILLDGKLRAKWKKERGRVVVTPFAPLAPAALRLIRSAAEKLFSDEPLEVVFL